MRRRKYERERERERKEEINERLINREWEDVRMRGREKWGNKRKTNK